MCDAMRRVKFAFWELSNICLPELLEASHTGEVNQVKVSLWGDIKYGVYLKVNGQWRFVRSIVFYNNLTNTMQLKNFSLNQYDPELQ